MATISSLRARHEAILVQYAEHDAFVRSVQRTALDELVPALVQEAEQPLDEAQVNLLRDFLHDSVTVFRFCRRARFSLPQALKLLHITLSTRLVTPSLSLLPAAGSGHPSPPFPLYPLPSTASADDEGPLFFFHPQLYDKFNRPCAILNLRNVKRDEDGELEGLKQVIRVGWEIGRRWLGDSTRRARVGQGKVPEGGTAEAPGASVQMVVMVDLEGAGMSNLEVELLPFFMDLLKNHFPGMVGAIFVLNYGWMYAGMWQLAKRVLPNTALERILFPTPAELLQFFDRDNLLVEHGGTVSYTYSPANPILKKYTRPPVSFASSSPASAYPSPLPSPSVSLGPSRNASYESIYDVFHSVPNTPRLGSSMLGPLSTLALPPTGSSHSHSSSLGSLSSFAPAPVLTRRSTTGLSMTTIGANSLGLVPSTSSTSLHRTTSTGGGIRPPPRPNMRRIPSLIDIQNYIGETAAAIQSDDDDDDDEGSLNSELDASGEAEMEEGDPDDDFDEESVVSSRPQSRIVSRNVSRGNSRESSPIRRNRSLLSLAEGGTFSSRAVKFSGKFQLSPYNTSNPYYGYPAFYPAQPLPTSSSSAHLSAAAPSSAPHTLPIPRPHYHRRRKRDLLRTLTYLAVLRFLALHRQIQKRLRGGLQFLLATVGWNISLGAISPRHRYLASLAAEDEATLERRRRRRRLDQAIYILVLFVIFRSTVVANLAALVFKRAPRAVYSGLVGPGRFNSLSGSSASCAAVAGVLASGASGHQVAAFGQARRKRDVVLGLLGLRRPKLA